MRSVPFARNEHIAKFVLSLISKTFCRVYGWKTDIESTNWEGVYLYHKLIGKVIFRFGIWFTHKKLRNLFDLIFLIQGIVISLNKETRKRRVLSTISVLKQTPCATFIFIQCLKLFNFTWPILFRVLFCKYTCNVWSRKFNGHLKCKCKCKCNGAWRVFDLTNISI